MPEKKFDLNKTLNAAGLYTKINYGDVYIPDTQRITNNFETWRKSQDYKTEEEKLKEAQERASAAMAELGNSEDVYDWYNAHQSDPRKQFKFREDGAKTAGLLMTVPLTVASAGTMGWVPALTSTATGFAGAYGGQKLGEVIDTKYGTNTTPWLTLAGGFAGGIGGYKGLVKAGSAGLLKGSGQMYGKQFIGDVVGDVFNKGVKTSAIKVPLQNQRQVASLKQLWNENLDPYFQVGTDPHKVPSELPETVLPLSQLKTDFPNASIVPVGKQTNVWSIDGNSVVSGKNVAYDRNWNGTNHRILKIGNKRYYVGTDPVKTKQQGTLIHQGALPMKDSSVIPIDDGNPLVNIWWEQNSPFYTKMDHPKARTSTYIIDDVVPTTPALEKSKIFGTDRTMLSDAVDLADPNINFKFFTYDPISGEMVQSPFVFPKQPTKGAYTLFERPSKLTFEERMGIPKGDRANLTQDQLEGLEDLMHYNTSGKYRWHLNYNDKTGFTRTTAANRPEGSVPGVKALLDHGATSVGYENAPVDLRTKTGSWTIWPGRKNSPAKFSGGDFPTPEGMGWAPGDLSLMLDGNTGKGLKVIMTSPRVDLANNWDDASQALLESLPNTIDKNIMRRFWQNNDQVILPGSYLSGDNGTLPLGLNGISAIDQGKGMSGAVSEILHPTRFRPHGSGLSPDSMLSILKQGQRPGHAVRYGPGFTQLNNSAVYNKHIYDAWTKYKSGAMTADEFKTIFDDWFVPQGGRPLEIRTPNKFRWGRNNDGTKTLVQQEQTPYIVFPHPYVHYKKIGGKIKNGK